MRTVHLFPANAIGFKGVVGGTLEGAIDTFEGTKEHFEGAKERVEGAKMTLIMIPIMML